MRFVIDKKLKKLKSFFILHLNTKVLEQRSSKLTHLQAKMPAAKKTMNAPKPASLKPASPKPTSAKPTTPKAPGAPTKRKVSAEERAAVVETLDAQLVEKRAATMTALLEAAGLEAPAPKTRKPREPLTTEAKAAMAEKRKATLDAKKAAAPAALEPKARKPREPLTTEAKAAMAAKRAATLAAKKAAAPAALEGQEPKARKPREPLSDEAKAAMAEKRKATLAAKKAAAPAAVEGQMPKARKPREPLTDEKKAAMAAKRTATLAAKKALKMTDAAPNAEVADEPLPVEPDSEPKSKKAKQSPEAEAAPEVETAPEAEAVPEAPKKKAGKKGAKKD